MPQAPTCPCSQCGYMRTVAKLKLASAKVTHAALMSADTAALDELAAVAERLAPKS